MTDAGRRKLEDLKRTFTRNAESLHKDLLKLNPDDAHLENKIKTRLMLGGQRVRPTDQVVQDVAQMLRDGEFGAPYSQDD